MRAFEIKEDAGNEEKIVYTIAGLLVFFSVAQGEEAANTAQMQKAREIALAVGSVKDSTEFTEARVARKAYSDAVDSIPEIAALKRQVPASLEEALRQKKMRDQMIKKNEKSLRGLKKAMDEADRTLLLKIKAQQPAPQTGEHL